MAVRTLTCNFRTLLNGSPTTGSIVTLSLLGADHTGSASVLISKTESTTDSSGDCIFTNLIPNVDGSQSQQYRITVRDSGKEVLNEVFTMPDNNSDLHDLIGSVVSDSTRSPYLDADQTFTGTNTFGTTAAPKTTVFNGAIDLDGNVITDFLDQDDMSSNSATAVASQQSVKAYVDAQVATVDTLAEVLALGNTTGGTNIVVTAGDAVTTDTINETTAGSGVTIDSVLIKDNAVTATTFTGALAGNATTATTAGTVTTANQPAITGLGTILALVAASADINAGTVDAVIGGTTPAAGTFTTLTANTNLTLATGATVTGIDNGTLGTSATLLATQGAIKTYVDAQVGTVDTLAEILANGNTTGGTDLAISASDDVTFTDSSKAIFGASSDLQIYHNGSTSYIYEQGTGDLRIRGNEVRIEDGDGSTIALFQNDAGAQLRYDGSTKLTTTSTGIDVTGAVTADDGIISGANPTLTMYETDTTDLNTRFDNGGGDLYIQTVNDSGASPKTRILLDHSTGDISFYEDTGTTAKLFWDASAESLGIGTSSPATALDVTGVITTDGMTTSADINFGDNDKAVFGAGSDLEIYHNGTDSFIDEKGAGWLYIRGNNTVIGKYTGETYIKGIADGAVELYYDNAVKLATTSTGIDVTGITVSDGMSTNTLGTSNFIAGVNAGNSIVSGGNYNVLVGDGAGAAITTGDHNTSLGYQALNANTTGASNTASGYKALNSNTTGGSNTASGYSALRTNTTGANNIAVGPYSLYSNTTGVSNIGVGHSALRFNTTGGTNTAIGQNALYTNTAGINNVGIGTQTLYLNTTGGWNVAIGQQALQNNTTAFNNVAIGGFALLTNTTGQNNIAIGKSALQDATTASNLTAVGHEALKVNTTGTNNVATGYQALKANTTGANNISIGYTAGDAITTGSNNTIIGNLAGTASMSDTVLIGAGTAERMRIDSSGNVGIGTSSPGAKLEVSGEALVGSGTDGVKLTYSAGNSTGIIDTGYTSTGLEFRTANAERMRIDSSGIDVTGGVTIDQNGNAVALNIDTEATSAGEAINISLPTQTAADVLRVYGADSLTTGSAASFHSNSASTSTRNVVEIINDNTAATGATALSIQQDAAARALFVDHNGNNAAIFVDASLTSSNSAVDIRADTLTTGAALYAASNSADTSTRNVVKFINEHASASGATVLHLKQDAAQRALFIDQNGQAAAIEIDTESTGTAIHIVNPEATSTSGVIFLNGANSLTTGLALAVTSNSSSTSTRNLVSFVNDNPLATGAKVLNIQQDAAQHALFIDQNGNGNGIYVDSEATTANVITAANTVTSGSVFVATSSDWLTTGSIINVASNSASTSTRDLVRVVNDNTAATGATVLNIRQDAAQDALFIDQNADAYSIDIDTEAAQTGAIRIQAATATTAAGLINIADADALTTGSIANFTSNSASNSTRNLVQIVNDNTAATGATALKIKQDAATQAVFIDQNANAKALQIDSDGTTTNGSGIYIAAHNLTTGTALTIDSNSSSTSTRNLVEIINDNAAAANAIALSVRNDATGSPSAMFVGGGGVGISEVASFAPAATLEVKNDSAAGTALKVNQDVNAVGVMIDSEATNGPALDIEADTFTAPVGIIHIDNAWALTTGRGLYLKSNSADTSTRNLIHIINDNALATGATALNIQQDAAQRALFIDQNGNGSALTIDSEATTASRVLDIPSPAITTGRVIGITGADSLTTGSLLYLVSNSASTSARNLVEIINDNTAATGATALNIRQDAAQRALFIDQNGNGTALNIDSESTTSDVLKVNANAITTGRALDVVVSPGVGFTTGSIARFYSGSSDSGTKNLVEMTNDNGGASGSTVLNIQQDASTTALKIAHSANGHSLDINTPSASAAYVSRVINANSLTTGRVFYAHSNSASTSTRNLVEIVNDNSLATGTHGLHIRQDSISRALSIDHNANGRSIDVDSTATTTEGMFIDMVALTTGKAAHFRSTGSSTSTRTVVQVENNDSLATGATALTVTQAAAQRALFIDQNGGADALVIDSESVTQNAIDIESDTFTTGSIINIDNADALTTGKAIKIISNSASTDTRGIIYVHQDNTLATSTRGLEILQDSTSECIRLNKGTTNGGMIDFRATVDSDAVSAISDLTTSGATTHHVQVEINGTKAWIAVSTNNPS
jgi:hypothetical protein